jgi:serine/threonine protein phosphatase PrpC
MEDFHCIKQALGKNPYISYFSIFDGHGGKEVSSYLSLNFHRILIKEINSINFSINDDENIKNIMNAIKNSFEKIDQELLNNNNFSNDVGSTATIIIIYCNENEINEKKVYNRTLICANVGDSNGFLINKNYIKLITKGHKCEDPSEVKRIKEQGGIVFQGRIYGKLILTRTLGDKEMKKYGVVPIPDFFCKKISNDDLFVIIGSDGVWDIIEENEIYQIGIEKGLSSEEFSKKLINISKERDTRDNASCIVVKLNKNI